METVFCTCVGILQPRFTKQTQPQKRPVRLMRACQRVIKMMNTRLNWVSVWFALVFGGTAVAQDRMSTLIPAYFYPGQEWSALNSAAATINVTAIMNPNSGVGSSQDANYVAAVSSLRSAGGRSIGYVATGYEARTVAAVTAEIDLYRNWYGGANGIRGIFLDEMSNSGSAASTAYYRQIYDYIKAIDSTWTVIGNPGTTTSEAYLNGSSGRTVDTLVVFENTHAAYANYTPSAWNINYDRSNFAHMVYAAPDAAAMTTDINLAANRTAGYVYVTSDILTNPWDTLPPYWSQEVSQISITPVPEPAGLLGAGLLGLLLWRFRLGLSGV
jgi:hypothetical protein